MLFETDATNWLILGLGLSILELVVPGTYLIWFGFAGIAMSLLTYFADFALSTQIVWFAVFSVIFAVVGWFSYRFIFKKMQTPKEYRNLNDSAQQYVGRIVTVAEDVVDNQTKVKVGDTYWLAYAEKPLKKGATAKVKDVKDSLILVIE
ncbi:MAG: NfeD family protein [Alphaproteobacteria bacterium]|nr:NfeD family protein [Alphaproteobacteria bacterium]